MVNKKKSCIALLRKWVLHFGVTSSMFRERQASQGLVGACPTRFHPLIMWPQISFHPSVPYGPTNHSRASSVSPPYQRSDTHDMATTRESSSEHHETVASLYFLAQDPKYDTYKPYTVRFDTEGKFPYTNIDNVKHDIELRDLRPILERAPKEISWKHHGFQVIKIPERLSYEDFNNDEVVRGLHIPHILTVLQNEFSTAQIHVLDYRVSQFVLYKWRASFWLCCYKVRKRDSNFPVRSDREYQFLQPSSRVHIGEFLYEYSPHNTKLTS